MKRKRRAKSGDQPDSHGPRRLFESVLGVCSGGKGRSWMIERSAMKRTPLPFRPAKMLAIGCTCALLGCAVSFIGPYDEVTDRAITDLQNRTELFLNRVEVADNGYEANQTFYREMKASLATIRLREEIYARKLQDGSADPADPTLKEIRLLQENFENLERLQKAGSLSGLPGRTAHQLIETNFRSLLQLELAKKRSSGVSAPKSS